MSRRTPRLMAAAKEFNIGYETLVDFLVGKGLARREELKAFSKLTEEMYQSAIQEFQGDKFTKIKSDLVDLPKGVAADLKKKKEDEEIIFKKEKEEKKPLKVEEAKEEPAKQEIPELEGPKVVDKIDLSLIDSSTRPKKQKEVVEKSEETAPTIENIKLENLTGPKILGKIDLPVENDTRPKHDEKRKRMRIPIGKREDRFKREVRGGSSRVASIDDVVQLYSIGKKIEVVVK